MQLIMKNMGRNLLIVPREGDIQSTYLYLESQPTLSEETTNLLANDRNLLSRYYVSVLQARVSVEGHSVILSGTEPAASSHESREKNNLTIGPRGGAIATAGTRSVSSSRSYFSCRT